MVLHVIPILFVIIGIASQGAVICVSLLNRLLGDQISASKDIMEEWQERPQKLAIKFIKKRLNM